MTWFEDFDLTSERACFTEAEGLILIQTYKAWDARHVYEELNVNDIKTLDQAATMMNEIFGLARDQQDWMLHLRHKNLCHRLHLPYDFEVIMVNQKRLAILVTIVECRYQIVCVVVEVLSYSILFVESITFHPFTEGLVSVEIHRDLYATENELFIKRYAALFISERKSQFYLVLIMIIES